MTARCASRSSVSPPTSEHGEGARSWTVVLVVVGQLCGAVNPPEVPGASPHDGRMALKRISMAGSDIAITDAAVADLVLEYAMHLGRAGTTDVVTVPVPDHGREVHVDLLLGPSSQ